VVTESTHKRYTQVQLCKIFSEQAGIIYNSELRLKIWFNPTDNFSLRLSLEGYRFVTQDLKIQPYIFKLDRPLVNKNLLQLERHFQSIYYIFKKTIVVFDEQEAVMLTLHNNDLPTYLNNLEINNIDN
jgi:hypothetical protein